jgi:hypothetical protein
MPTEGSIRHERLGTDHAGIQFIIPFVQNLKYKYVHEKY